MPLARWRPLAKAANFAPSGWYAATPMPAANTATRTRKDGGARAGGPSPPPPPAANPATRPRTYAAAPPAAPPPPAASATPPGRSHIAPRWSDHSPKSGWAGDDETGGAGPHPPAAVGLGAYA